MARLQSEAACVSWKVRGQSEWAGGNTCLERSEVGGGGAVTTGLEIGAAAPDFTLPSDEGVDVSLSGLRGRWVVLFFYPKAMTPGCTTEACGFRDVHAQLRSMGAEVLGISHDSIERLRRFREKNGLDYPLLSDPEHRVTGAYGVYGPKKMAGREYMGIIRSTFLIDPEGRIQEVWRKVRVRVKRKGGEVKHAEIVLQRLKELQGKAP